MADKGPAMVRIFSLYALSNYFRSQAVVTVLGGPHARSFPDDAIQYFDYVLGFTNKSTIQEVLKNCVSQKPIGKYLSAGKQPVNLCGVRERWKFIESTLKKAPFIKMVPMLGSVGCPYTCSFCIDSVVPYHRHWINMIFNYLPYVQTNFVLGLDSDSGDEPFELTKRFVDHSPRAFPGYSLLTAFGESAPINLEYQKAERVLPFPFHFLNNHLAMNVKPKNYDWVSFYDKVIDLTEFTFSVKAIYRRFKGTSDPTSRWMNFMRAISQEGYGRLRFYRQIRENLINNKSFRRYFEGETRELPQFYKNIIKWLPTGAMEHDANAFLHKQQSLTV